MYLLQGRENRPHLDLRLDEPTLMRSWFLNLPIAKMNVLWRLDYTLGDEWADHFRARILDPNYRNGRVGRNGQRNGGSVATTSLVATARKWDEWMASSTEPASFKNVKLKQFVSSTFSPLPALLLATDTYCIQCDELEPTWLFSGTETMYSGIHENYETMINNVLNHSLFGFNPEQDTCPVCNPNTRYATPAFLNFARRRPGMCECMPCRRAL